MDKRTLDYINSLIQDEERSSVKQALYEVINEVKERKVIRTKLLYEGIGLDLVIKMVGPRFWKATELRNNLKQRNIECNDIIAILLNKIESIH